MKGGFAKVSLKPKLYKFDKKTQSKIKKNSKYFLKLSADELLLFLMSHTG